MNARRLALLAALSLTAVVAPVRANDTAPAADKHTCLIARTISSWSSLDDRTLLIRAGARKYRVTFFNSCRESRWAWTARSDHFGMCVRAGDTLTFSTDPHPLGSSWPHWRWDWPGHGFEERCHIQSIEALPADWQPPAKPAT